MASLLVKSVPRVRVRRVAGTLKRFAVFVVAARILLAAHLFPWARRIHERIHADWRSGHAVIAFVRTFQRVVIDLLYEDGAHLRILCSTDDGRRASVGSQLGG